MESKKTKITSKLLRFYFSDRFAPETAEKVQKWLANNSEAEGVELASKEFWNSIPPQKDANTFVTLKKVNKRIGVQPKKKHILLTNKFLKVAAMFILLIGINGVWFYLKIHDNPSIVEILAEYGETKQVTLPDQTKVWLNAGSTLKYPEVFDSKTRSVSLSGEAFFSVTKNKSKPFLVKTKNLTVKVLGTKFNVKAYPKEHRTFATLQEGKIEVQAGKLPEKQLVPNEQLVFNSKTSMLKVIKVNPNNLPDWQSGKLRFAEATLAEILKTLERRFNISFDIDKTLDTSSEQYTVKFERDETVEQMLEILAEITGSFSYSIKNKQILIENSQK